MTDEQMANESLISYRKEPKWAGKIFMQDENTCYKEGFLAGLKAGRQQWHDLRKDPNDLPKNRRNVWITYINGYNQRENTEASFRYKYWVISGHRTGCEVIAWCEIPTFDKE